MRRWLLLALLMLPLVATAALRFPALTGRVVDQAGVLDARSAQTIEQRLEAFEQQTGTQLVVVTLSSLQGDSIEDYGYQLGRAWGIGQKGKNNGALLVVAPKEHRTRIEVGYGLEGELTDAASKLIIEQIMIPHFKTGDYAGGIAAGVEQIIAQLGGSADAAPAQQPQQPHGSLLGVLLPLLFLFFFLRSLRGQRSGFLAPLVIGSMLSSSRSDSGGFGAFSGGGGSFGGGGASGGW